MEKMEWNGEHRAFLIENYFKYGSKGAINEFRKNWVKKFKASGTTLSEKRCGSVRRVRTPENIKKIKQAIQQSPLRSARKHALALGFARESVRRVLKLDLKFHPYKMIVVHELQMRDYQNRKVCCSEMLRSVAENENILTSDEAHFHLSGFVNKQNFRYWADENPQNLIEKPLHSERVTVWCGIGTIGVVGPYFFEEEGRCVTVNSDRYSDMLLNFLKPRLESLGGCRELWFQQDGATAHTASKSVQILKNMFPSRLISIRGDIAWPARSPDLAPCDFFLWGYIKEKVYINRPKTIDELKEKIVEEIRNLSQSTINEVMSSFRNRLKECIDKEGHHLSDTIFKS